MDDKHMTGLLLSIGLIDSVRLYLQQSENESDRRMSYVCAQAIEPLSLLTDGKVTVMCDGERCESS